MFPVFPFPQGPSKKSSPRDAFNFNHHIMEKIMLEDLSTLTGPLLI